MLEFKNGERPSTIMGRIAKGYTDAELPVMAKYFSELPWVQWMAQRDVPPLEEARSIHEKACAECHDAVVEVKRAGKHVNVGCEACHGPQAKHAEDPSL